MADFRINNGDRPAYGLLDIESTPTIKLSFALDPHVPLSDDDLESIGPAFGALVAAIRRALDGKARRFDVGER